MASVQVRHQRSCALATTSGKDGKPRPTWTKLAALDEGFCSCTPAFVVVTAIGDGKLARETVGTDRRAAEERAADVKVLTRTRKYDAPPPALKFSVFADQWLAGLERRATTVREYKTTIAYAKKAFGRKPVSRLTVADVRKFLEVIRADNRERRRRREPETGKLVPVEASAATIAKHLRQLGACLEAAIPDFRSDNPVRHLDKASRPRVAKRRPAFFTDAELRRLWSELEGRPVYLTMFKLGALTGLRIGELAGLRWGDVRLVEGEIEVRAQFTHGQRVETPKDSEQRTVFLPPQARELLEEWYRETGDDGLVFENEAGGPIDDSRARKVLYAAMKRAGVPREGESGRARTIHSLRHTAARIMLERRVPIDWVRRQLGHSSVTLTVDLYGHWSTEAAKAEAEKLAGAFPV